VLNTARDASNFASEHIMNIQEGIRSLDRMGMFDAQKSEESALQSKPRNQEL